jgi:hypothetical protein
MTLCTLNPVLTTYRGEQLVESVQRTRQLSGLSAKFFYGAKAVFKGVTINAKQR